MITITTLIFSLILPAMAQEDAEIVKVNGIGITKNQMVEKLIQRYAQTTIDDMVNELLLRQEIKARKIEPDAAELDKRVAAISAQFPTKDAFQDRLKQTGASEASLREEVGDQLALERLVIQDKKLSVTDKEVKEAFEKNKERLATPPSVHLRHIQVKTKKEADDILAQLKSGADFTQLAKERSVADSGKLAGGDYGFVPRGVLPPEIDKPVFAMKVGETKYLESRIGHHVLQVLAAKPAQPAELAKIKDSLRDRLLAEKIQASLPVLVKGLRAKADIKFTPPTKN
ncbi:MAG: peptidyl-prolyl cis-trans isomerase [Elusimicrobia bacterium]|nr:peptidyl-prolyl cis-trans isomerase [Elusimicrobiota bacterium]